MAWQCHRWGALPAAGGIYDQEDRLMHRMAALDNIYNVVQKKNNAVGKDIHQLTSGERKILKWLIDEGIIRG